MCLTCPYVGTDEAVDAVPMTYAEPHKRHSAGKVEPRHCNKAYILKVIVGNTLSIKGEICLKLVRATVVKSGMILGSCALHVFICYTKDQVIARIPQGG